MYLFFKDFFIFRYIENILLLSFKIFLFVKKFIYLGFDENILRNIDIMVNCRNWGGVGGGGIK